MEILPEVDEAAPPWNDAQSDVKPLKRGKCSDSLVSGGRLVGDRRGGCMVGYLQCRFVVLVAEREGD